MSVPDYVVKQLFWVTFCQAESSTDEENQKELVAAVEVADCAESPRWLLIRTRSQLLSSSKKW